MLDKLKFSVFKSKVNRSMIFRNIERKDNQIIAKIIRESLDSYGLGIPGTVYTDPTTDDLFSLFQTPNSTYIIVQENGEVLGGCGIFPTKGLPADHVELVKLYLDKKAKGRGLGKQLMSKCIEWARNQGFAHIYLETLNELSSAVKLYESMEFKNLNSPLGDSGHNACDIWMLREIKPT